MNGGRVANLYRLIAALLFAFVPLSSFADGGAFPATTGAFDSSACNSSSFPSPNPPADNPVWTCKAPVGNIRECGWSMSYQGSSWFIGQCNQAKSVDSCPAGANMSTNATGDSVCTCTAGLRPIDGQCVAAPSCPDGQHEEGGACVPDSCKPNETRVNGVCVPEPPCPAGQSRVNGQCKPFKCPTNGTASDQWYELESAGVSSTCLYNSADKTYCVLRVTPLMAGYKDGKLAYLGGYGIYTGGTCGPSEPGKPRPVDPKNPNGDPDKGTKPAGPNDPKPGDKPPGAGTGGGGGGGPGNTPSPPNPDGTCPAGTYKSGGQCYQKDPPPKPPDIDGKCPSGYVKVGDSCIPLMPPEDKDDGEEKSSFGGQCDAVACEGDAIQCAIVREQYRMNCKLFGEDTDATSLTNRALTGTDQDSAAALKGRAEQVSVSSFDQSGFGWSRSCPADPSFEVAGESFDIPFSKVCGVLGVFSNGALGLTLLGCLMWVVGRKD